MSSGAILVLYLCLLFADLLWEQILLWLNLGHLKSMRSRPPAAALEIWGRRSYHRALQYSSSRTRLSMISSLAGSALLAVLILSGWLGRLQVLVSSLAVGQIVQAILYVYLISLIFGIAGLPASLYSQFVIEARYGFNRMSWKLFLTDTLKSLVISAGLTTPLLAALFWMIRSTTLWWLWAFALFTTFQLVMMLLYPRLIAPLFNKFSPLEEGPLREKVQELAGELGFKTRGIFVMDSSKRSGHGNAYFSGLGRVKRIVLFDTLIRSLDENQVAGVLAHEIGHEKLGHIIKRLAVSVPAGLLGFWLLHLALNYPPLFAAFGFNNPSPQAALVLLMFASAPLTFFLKPIFSWWSRRHEYQADRFVKTRTRYAADLAEALRRLSKDNLSNPVPHPLYSFYHYSHPTTLERLAALSAE